MQKRNKPLLKQAAMTKKRLSKEEKGNLSLVLQDFCDSYHLEEVKKDLWEMVVAALGKSPSIYDDGKERSNLMFFYERLSTMIEAVYTLHHQPE